MTQLISKLSFRNSLSKILPYTNFGDRIISFYDFIKVHRRLPKSNLFNDRLFYIRSSDYLLNPLVQFTTDKEFVKIYIKSVLGNRYNVPTKAILKNKKEILNYQFEKGDVIKPTHASGIVIFFDGVQNIEHEFNSWLKINYYFFNREKNYKFLNPKIIVESLVFEKKFANDLKFFCHKGKVKIIQLDIDRHIMHKRNFYDTKWNLLNISMTYPNSNQYFPSPVLLKEMIKSAEKLSKPFNLVRIDMYYDDNYNNFYVGEITHCHEIALGKFDSLQSEIEFSKKIFNNDFDK